MPTTLTQLIANLRENRLDEREAHQWQDDELRRWINEGTRDVARRAEILFTTSDVAFGAGVQEVTAPTDVLRIHRAEWRPTSQDQIWPLEYRDFHGMDSLWWTQQTVTQNTPMYFTLWGYTPNLKIVLYPTPYEVGVVKIHYYKTPTEFALDGTEDGDSVDLPEGWADLVLDYAEYKALRKDRSPAWQEAKGEYEQHLEQLIEHSRRLTDQVGFIDDASSPFVPQWLYGGDY